MASGFLVVFDDDDDADKYDENADEDAFSAS